MLLLARFVTTLAQIAESAILEYDRLRLKDMSAHVGALSVLIDLAAHGQIFCSALRFKSWYELLMER